MRCLQCGSQLALLKKFTDGEFCSTEHRTLFYDTQQRLIVERLEASARKLKRYKLVTKNPEPVVAPAPPPPEPIPAPRTKEILPPFAVLVAIPVLDALAARNHPYALTPAFAFAVPELLLVSPSLPKRDGKSDSRLVSPVPTFLAAKSWKRYQQIEAKAVPAFETNPVFPELSALRGFGSPRMRSAAVARRHPAKTHPVGGLSFADNTFAGELSSFGGTLSRPEFETGSTAGDSDMRTQGRWIAPALPTASDSAAVPERAEVTPASERTSPAIPRLAEPHLNVPGLNAIPRAFRMRPRNPVADSSLAEFCGIEPNQVTADPVKLSRSLVSPVPEVELLGPAACNRFFRARPRGPVLSPATPESERIAPQAGLTSEGRPFLPSLDATGSAELALLFPGRFLRMRPRGPVLDNAGVESASVGAADVEPFIRSLSEPSYELATLADLAPRFLDRGFRMRPRGAVAADGLASSETIVPQSLESPGLHAPKPSLPASIVGENVPVFVERGFRPRPRGPVPSTAVAPFERAPSGEPASLASSPALGHLAAAMVGECSPKPVRRFYRIGPKASPQTVSVPTSESIAPGILETLQSGPALAALRGSVAGEFSPVRIERFFRARPRGPVETLIPAALEQISSGNPAVPALAASTGTLPAHLIGECAPNSLSRFFRARPRGPVEAVSILGFETIPCGSPADLVSNPRMAGLPLAVIGECAPNVLARFFRARPRGPMEGTLSAMESIAAGSPAGLVSKPAGKPLPAAAFEFAPCPVVRFFRARPRGPVDANTPSMASGARLPFLETKSGVSLASLPPIAADTVQPAFANNPFLMRPRGGVQAKDLRAFYQIDGGLPAAVESRPVLGSLPLSTIGSLAPDQLDRFYKMRPRGPVQANQLAAFRQIPPGESAVPVRSGQVPALATMDVSSFEPVFLDRFYRMRPRGPLQPGAASFESVSAGAPEVLIPRAAIPSMPAVLMRQARTPSRDRGPRMRPPGGGPRPNSGTRNFDSHDEEADQDTRVPQASKSALPDGILSDWAGPAGWVRVSEPLALESAPAALRTALDPIECGFFIKAPLFSAELIVDYRPSLVDVRMAYEESHKPTWFERITQFWSEATWDVKWVTAAVPILLGVMIHSSVTRLPLSLAPAKMDIAALASNPLPPLKSVMDAKWFDLRNELVGRAAVDLQEDFTRGLRFWAGDANWSNSWAYDIHGGVKPGTLALYTPSIGMSDYDLEFTGEIETKSLGWAFRAADTRNYYSVKLTTIRPGPMPTVALVRSAVIDGKEGPSTQTLLPFPVSKDQVYRVRMEVSGQFFTVYVQGHVVAFWSDERLKTGGIGFYSSKGEQSRLLAVRVSHQFDALGRLCASLALQDNSVRQTGVSRNESKK